MKELKKRKKRTAKIMILPDPETMQSIQYYENGQVMKVIFRDGTILYNDNVPPVVVFEEEDDV